MSHAVTENPSCAAKSEIAPDPQPISSNRFPFGFG